VVGALRERSPGSLIFGVGRGVARVALDGALAVDIGASSNTQLGQFMNEVRPDFVVNCLGAVTVQPDRTRESNVVAVDVLLSAVEQLAAMPGFIQIGSSAEYAPLPRPEKTSERSATTPVSEYGRSKLEATEMVLRATAVGKARGTVLRFFNVIGPGMSSATLPGRICRYLAQPDTPVLELGSLGDFRDYFDVRDGAAAVAAAVVAFPQVEGEIINIGSGVARMTRALVGGLFSNAGLRSRFEEDDAGSDRSGPVPWQEAAIAKAGRMLRWKAEVPWNETLSYIASGCCGGP
jgi:NDP-hexose 4-ketoreductase